MHSQPSQEDKAQKVALTVDMSTPAHVPEWKRALIAKRDELFDKLCDAREKLVKWELDAANIRYINIRRNRSESHKPLIELIRKQCDQYRLELLELDAEITGLKHQPVDIQLSEVN